LEIKIIQPDDINLYQALATINGSIFNDIKWIKKFGKDIELFGIYNNDNKLIGGFYIYIEKIYGFKFYKDPPFTPSIGLFFQNQAINNSNYLSYEKEIFSLVCNFIKQLPFSVLRISIPVNFTDLQHFIWQKFKVIPNYTYLINLDLKEEELNRNLSPKLRNNIKKAISDKIIVEQINDYNIVKQHIIATYSRQKIKINYTILNEILFGFSDNSNSFSFLASQDGIPLSVVFCVYDKNKAYYLFGGYNDASKHEGAGCLALWEAIRYSKSLGIKYFDLEGSMVPRIEKFFRGFGGVLTPYFTINRASLPLEMILKFIKREIY
jgi:hypothetical protein